MATSVIKGDGIKTFEGTRASDIANGFCYGTYDTKTRLVTINLQCSNGSTAINTSQTLFTIPSEYAPSENKNGSCFGFGASAVSTGQIRVSTSGTIRQVASNARVAYIGVIQYTI